MLTIKDESYKDSLATKPQRLFGTSYKALNEVIWQKTNQIMKDQREEVTHRFVDVGF